MNVTREGGVKNADYVTWKLQKLYQCEEEKYFVYINELIEIAVFKKYFKKNVIV